jgi:putative acetyltransferase
MQEDIQAARAAPIKGLVVRAARPGDAEAIAALINRPGFRWGTLRAPFTTPETVASWLGTPQPGSLSLVATVADLIVGQAGLAGQSGRRAHVGRIGMGVDDDWTGRGVGTALLRALLDAGEEWLGLTRIELTVFCDNAAAIALYRRFGFEIEGTHRRFALRAGRLVDAYAMARLRPGEAS